MKYENLIEEFDFDQHELESISNEEAVEVIDNMFNDFDYSNFKELDNTGKYQLIKDGANLMLSSEDMRRRYMKQAQDVVICVKNFKNLKKYL